MAVFACPSCGRPTKISLASPRAFRCAACGHAGDTPADLAARLEEAARWLFHTDLRHRQVGVEQRRQLDRLVAFSRLYLVLALPPTLVLLVIALSGFQTIFEDKHVRWWSLALFQPPFFGFVALVAVMWRKIVARRRDVEASRAAVPGVPGEPPDCRACGGPLPRAPGPYVACEYCNCDNLVDADVLRRTSRDTTESLDQFEARMKKAASDAASASVASIGKFIVASIGLPVAWLAVFCVIVVMISFVFPPSHDPRMEVALVPYGREKCVAEMRETTDGPVFVDAQKLPDGQRLQKKAASRREVDIATEASIAGKQATWYACSNDKFRTTHTVTIKRVNDWMGSPRIDVTDGSGTESWSSGLGCGLCFR